jgi:4-diphosphocytidyl-2-C-methyl-D-erythritol kinase
MEFPAKLASPAKLNLFLKIKHRRNDGYHELESLFQTIDLSDEILISFAAGKEDEIIFNLPKILSKENTISKTLALIRERAAARGKEVPPLAIRIIKHIPAGSGLGGGSSNAAVLMKWLNLYFDLGFSLEELVKLAAEVGSDVPFFLYGGLAIVSGRGENVTPVSIDVEATVLIAVPRVRVTTVEAYRLWDEDQIVEEKVISLEEAIDQLKKRDFSKRSLFYNSFEAVIRRHYPEIDTVFQVFEQNNLRPALSGSGSAVYAFVSPEANDLAKIKLELEAKKVKMFVAKMLKAGAVE